MGRGWEEQAAVSSVSAGLCSQAQSFALVLLLVTQHSSLWLTLEELTREELTHEQPTHDQLSHDQQ